jgi:AraC-like DNA-binding protein
MNISVTNMLFVLIIFQLLLLSFFLFTQQKGKRISNRLLGFFFLAICLNLLDVFLLSTGIYFSYPHFAGLGSCIPLLFGPLLYFYTRSILYKSFTITPKNLLHFLPFVIFFSATEYYYLIQTREVQEEILRVLLNHHFPKAITLVSTVIFIQFLFYAFFSLRLVSQYKKATGQLFSNPMQTDVSWLYSTIIFFISLMVITTLNGLLTQTPMAKYYLIAFNIIILAMLVFVIRVLMKALRQSYFFSFRDDKDISGRFSSSSKSILSETAKSEKEAMAQTVSQYMQSNKPYLEPELTLDQLAVLLAFKPRILSQVINEILQQNFFDFINRYRIEEARRLLTNPEDKKITILEVLYKVGFNSKSSFNTLFKKYTGLTPTEFKKKQAR